MSASLIAPILVSSLSSWLKKATFTPTRRTGKFLRRSASGVMTTIKSPDCLFTHLLLLQLTPILFIRMYVCWCIWFSLIIPLLSRNNEVVSSFGERGGNVGSLIMFTSEGGALLKSPTPDLLWQRQQWQALRYHAREIKSVGGSAVSRLSASTAPLLVTKEKKGEWVD